eukprot:899370-Rhodomonas_salina.1
MVEARGYAAIRVYYVMSGTLIGAMRVRTFAVQRPSGLKPYWMLGTTPIPLRISYTMPGTDLAYVPTTLLLRTCYAVSSTDLGYGAVSIGLRARYAVSGTDIALAVPCL